MNDFLQHYGAAAVTAASIVANAAWSSYNLHLMRKMEKHFVTRVEFHAEQRVNALRHHGLDQRLERAGA